MQAHQHLALTNCCIQCTVRWPDACFACDSRVVARRHTMLQFYGGACQTAAAGSRPHNGAEPEMSLSPH